MKKIIIGAILLISTLVFGQVKSEDIPASITEEQQRAILFEGMFVQCSGLNKDKNKTSFVMTPIINGSYEISKHDLDVSSWVLMPGFDQPLETMSGATVVSQTKQKNGLKVITDTGSILFERSVKTGELKALFSHEDQKNVSLICQPTVIFCSSKEKEIPVISVQIDLTKDSTSVKRAEIVYEIIMPGGADTVFGHLSGYAVSLKKSGSTSTMSMEDSDVKLQYAWKNGQFAGKLSFTDPTFKGKYSKAVTCKLGL